MVKPSRATYVPGRDPAPEARTYGVRRPGSSSAGTAGGDGAGMRARSGIEPSAPGGDAWRGDWPATSGPLPAEDAVVRNLRSRRRQSMGLLVLVGAGILVIVLLVAAGALVLAGKLG